MSMLPLIEGIKKSNGCLSNLSSTRIAKSTRNESNEHKKDSDGEEKEEEEEIHVSTMTQIVTNTSAAKESEEDNSGFRTADSVSDHLHRAIANKEKNNNSAQNKDDLVQPSTTSVSTTSSLSTTINCFTMSSVLTRENPCTL